jgi:hypothetical protein
MYHKYAARYTGCVSLQVKQMRHATQQRVQPDAAGAARNLGATFQRYLVSLAPALTTAASSAADADVGPLITLIGTTALFHSTFGYWKRERTS